MTGRKALLRRDVDARQAAIFLIATYEGYTSLAKNAQDVNVWKVGIKAMVAWLQSLRAPTERKDWRNARGLRRN
jgi:TetR/AcrR family transcriptional regulator, transcriptional repressor for nem operon